MPRPNQLGLSAIVGSRPALHGSDACPYIRSGQNIPTYDIFLLLRALTRGSANNRKNEKNALYPGSPRTRPGLPQQPTNPQNQWILNLLFLLSTFHPYLTLILEVQTSRMRVFMTVASRSGLSEPMRNFLPARVVIFTPRSPFRKYAFISLLNRIP